MDWKGQLAMAIGIFAVIAVVVVYVIPATSNRLPLRSDVRVGKVHEEQSGGIMSLLHYEVWGKVVNNGTLPSGPVTVTLNITSLKGALLFKTDAPVFPDTLSPGREGSFTFKFTSDDLGGYTGNDWTYYVSVSKQ
jgi:hypothetical protein